MAYPTEKYLALLSAIAQELNDELCMILENVSSLEAPAAAYRLAWRSSAILSYCARHGHKASRTTLEELLHD